jgi:hypothetical protein
MALARFVAAVDGMELTIKVPAVALVHPFVPVVYPGIEPVPGFSAHAVWEEVEVKGIGLPVMLVTVTNVLVPGTAKFAVILGFGAVTYE